MSPWFHSFDPLLTDGQPMRPLTLGTLEAMRVMQVTWLTDDGQLDLAQEQRQIDLIHWLHTAPIADVEQALGAGDFRAVQAGEVPDIIIARYRLQRSKWRAQIDAASIRILAKPDEKKYAARVPAEVVPPSTLDYRIFILMKECHLSRHEILWELPLAQALHLYHCAMWNQGHWTVRAGEAVTDDAFEGFEVGALSEEGAGDIDSDQTL